MSEPRGKQRPRRSILAEYLELAKQGKAIWAAFAGIFFNAFLITNIVLQLSDMSVSEIFVRIVEVYRGLIAHFFYPFKLLFDIEVPWYAQDLIALWVVSGQIGTIATVLVNRLVRQVAKGVLEKSKEPEARRRVVASRGEKYLEEETQFIQGLIDHANETDRRWKLLAFSNLLLGPLFAVHIWRNSASVPGTRVTPRGVIVSCMLLLLALFVVYLVLNFFALPSGQQ